MRASVSCSKTWVNDSSRSHLVVLPVVEAHGLPEMQEAADGYDAPGVREETLYKHAQLAQLQAGRVVQRVHQRPVLHRRRTEMGAAGQPGGRPFQ